jgi:long-subunit fatty acid transport protein
MKRSALLISPLVLFLVASNAAAQTTPVDVSSFYNSLATGTGARAWGMGGTQIAAPGDPETGSWNPAAPAGLKRPAARVAFSVGRVNGILEPTSYSFLSGVVPNTGSITPTGAAASLASVDSLRFAYPLHLAERTLVTSLAYQRHLSPPGQVDATYLFRHQSLYRFDYDHAYNGSGSGGFDTISVSIASEVASGVRVGATLHRWFGGTSASYRESYRYNIANYYGWDGAWTENLGDELRLDVSGFSVDLGAQLSVKNKYFVGVAYRSGVTTDIDYSNAASYENGYTHETSSARYSSRGSLVLPASIGAGAAVRLVPRLTVAVDHVRTRWSQARLESYARTTAQGAVSQTRDYIYPTMKPVGLVAQSDAGRTSTGGEYALNVGQLQLPLRAGVFYQQTYYDDGHRGALGTTLGVGIRWHGVSVDAAWIHDTAAGRYRRNSVCTSIGYAF